VISTVLVDCNDGSLGPPAISSVIRGFRSEYLLPLTITKQAMFRELGTIRSEVRIQQRLAQDYVLGLRIVLVP
jgi:hypothetical protein